MHTHTFIYYQNLILNDLKRNTYFPNFSYYHTILNNVICHVFRNNILMYHLMLSSTTNKHKKCIYVCIFTYIQMYVYIHRYIHTWASQMVLVVKNSATSAEGIRDSGLISGSGRSSRGGHGNSLQYSCLENPMDRGGCQAIVQGVAESDTTEAT